MRRLFTIISILALTACTELFIEQGPPDTSDRVFYAETPSDEWTRTYIDGSNTIFWTEDDRISLFRSPVNEHYRFTGGSGSTTGSFEKVDEKVPGTAYSKNFAVYPYSSESTSVSEGTFCISLPALQHYAVNGFGQGANTMVAVTQNCDDDKLKFRNVCSYLKLQIYGGDIIRSIKFYGKGEEKIAGQATVTAAYGEDPSIVMGESATTEITLDCGEKGVPTLDCVTSFWIVLPPTVFAEGFTVEVTNTSGTVRTISTSKSITFSRNSIKPMAAFASSLQSATNEILSFALTDGTDTYNAYSIGGGYIDVQVPEGTDLSNMKALFTHDGQKVTVDGVEQASGCNSHDFSDFVNPLEYVVTAENGGERAYTIRMFNLPILFVETEGQQEIVSKNNWLKCSFIIQTTNGVRTDFGVTNIEGRGNTSWSRQDKKPYTIKFEKKQEVFGYPKHKRWHLQSTYGNSMSFFRDDFLFEVARRSAAHGWAPHGHFIDLFINGKYRGLYWLCEKISVDKNRVNINELEPTDTELPALSGGYLMEYATGDELNFYSKEYNFRYFLKNPDEDVPDEQFNYIKDYINTLEESLKDDGRFVSREYEDYLDVDSWIDYWFMHEIANGTDITLPGYPGLSCFCYKDRGGKLKAGPVWDMHFSGKSSYHAKNCLYYQRLFDDPKFVNRVQEKWYGTATEKGFPELVGDVTARIDSIAPLIRQSGNRDLAIWGKSGSVESQAAAAKSNYTRNIKWMNDNIKLLEVNYDQKPGGNEDFDNQTDGSNGWMEK